MLTILMALFSSSHRPAAPTLATVPVPVTQPTRDRNRDSSHQRLN